MTDQKRKAYVLQLKRNKFKCLTCGTVMTRKTEALRHECRDERQEENTNAQD